MEKETSVIDNLIQKQNYSQELWEPRGLIPSPEEVISALEAVTNEFLKNLKDIHLDPALDGSERLEKTQNLVDELPWLDFDTEEREFLADTIAPAISSIGLDPWSII